MHIQYSFFSLKYFSLWLVQFKWVLNIKKKSNISGAEGGKEASC